MRQTALSVRLALLPLLAAALTMAASAGAQPTAGPLLAQGAQGILKVTCNVDGAVVMIDGVEVGETPLMLARDAGAYQLEVTKHGYSTFAQPLDVPSGKKVVVRADIEFTAGTVELDIAQEGATVLLDGDEVGSTPELRKLDVVLPGTHTLTVRKDAHETWEQEFTIQSKQQLTLTIALSANAAVLLVESAPIGAHVYGPNGEELGVTPMRKGDMAAGLQTLRLTANGYADAFVSVDVVRGETTQVEHTFTESIGTLKVIPDPDTAQVILDRYPLGFGEQKLDALSPGIHKLTIKAANYMEYTEDVLVQEGRTTSVRPQLAFLDTTRGNGGVSKPGPDKRKVPIVIAIISGVTAGTVIAIAAAAGQDPVEPDPPITDVAFQLP
jgi:hypothetical protein